MFEQHVRIEETTFGELEVGDRFLMHFEDGRYFWRYQKEGLARLSHCKKIEPRGTESVFDRTNATTVHTHGGTSWEMDDDHPVLHLKKFSVSEETFLDEMMKRIRGLFG